MEINQSFLFDEVAVEWAYCSLHLFSVFLFVCVYVCVVYFVFVFFFILKLYFFSRKKKASKFTRLTHLLDQT